MNWNHSAKEPGGTTNNNSAVQYADIVSFQWIFDAKMIHLVSHMPNTWLTVDSFRQIVRIRLTRTLNHLWNYLKVHNCYLIPMQRKYFTCVEHLRRKKNINLFWKSKFAFQMSIDRGQRAPFSQVYFCCYFFIYFENDKFVFEINEKMESIECKRFVFWYCVATIRAMCVNDDKDHDSWQLRQIRAICDTAVVYIECKIIFAKHLGS